MRNYNTKSNVEKFFLSQSGHPFCYPPQEKINIIEVKDPVSLGKFTALRFIEWLQNNPDGVISLPTGKTPEHFIKWTSYFLQNWTDKKVQDEISTFGLSTSKPDMNSFKFVQIDEFFPIDPQAENSFAFYINKFYFKEFGLNPKNALLMNFNPLVLSSCLSDFPRTPAKSSFDKIFPNGKVDLSLRFRNPNNTQEELQQKIIFAVDQFCNEYEQKILDLGGIGFFLGGIGPDGHIAFDIKGSDHFSTTRLTYINYQTAAASAGSFGGIEQARNKTVTTIGLRTIVQNPTTTAIIIASGQSKAKVVKDAVENNSSILYPATVLQQLEQSRFYVTQNAASLLIERQYQNLKKSWHIEDNKTQQILINICTKTNKQLFELTPSDLQQDHLGSFLLENKIDLKKISQEIQENLISKIQKGLTLLSQKTFLHTGPHHDDIMLGYLPYIINLTQDPTNKHNFAIMTSGFNSVRGQYVKSLLEQAIKLLAENSDIFSVLKNNNSENRDTDVTKYLQAAAHNNPEKQKEIETLRILRNICEIFDIELNNSNDLDILKDQLEELNNHLTIGKKDSLEIQKLKGRVREWEEELLWGHFGFNHNNIFNMRLGFYSSGKSLSQPEFERDVQPILQLLEQIQPDILTVTIDPLDSGPDTHYKALQAIRTATQKYLSKYKNKNLEIWGYRNVWYKFLPSEANIFVPANLNSLTILRNTFLNCYSSQRNASFPSTEYDGPFCDLTQKIMVEQFEAIKSCLGEKFFSSSNDNRLVATQGLCFIKSMTPQEFFDSTNF